MCLGGWAGTASARQRGRRDEVECWAHLSEDLQPGDMWGEGLGELIRAHWVGSGGNMREAGSSGAVETH